MPLNNRFYDLTKKWGFSVHPVCCRVNGKWTRREDILTVESHGKWIMTIPKQMYANDNPSYRDLLGIQQPNYYDCENVLYRRRYEQI